MTSKEWFDGVKAAQNSGKKYVLVTVMGSLGSTPREQGTKMTVTTEQVFGTIGGGNLEFSSIKRAREMMLNDKNQQHLEHYPLAAKLTQCCGGATHVLFESFVEHENTLLLFGAGHVASALVPILSQLPIQIDWVDSREDMFDNEPQRTNVRQHVVESIEQSFQLMDSAKWVLVMTHDHSLDYEIVQQALINPEVEYVGLIGSQTKAKRFTYRLKAKQSTSKQLDKLVCPVGELSIPGKRPIEVAVSIAGQIIQQLNKNGTPNSQQLKQSWQQTKQIADLV